MKITAETITREYVAELRVTLCRAAQLAFELQVAIDRSEITPAQAAADLATLLQPLQITEKP